MKQCIVICDLQFGSTGKGLLAGYLANKHMPDTVVTAWGPNAGHTYIDADGRKFVHTMLANGVVSPDLERIMIGPGSMINPANLLAEIEACEDLLRGVKIVIHPGAGVVFPIHRAEEEASMTAIGSTKKGTGAALASKIARSPGSPSTMGQWYSEMYTGSELFGLCTEQCPEISEVLGYVVSATMYEDYMDKAHTTLVEGAQGFSLGINQDFYPYCTSRECTPAQISVDCGVPVGRITDVIGTCRTYPIRVANRFDEDGNQIGWSGPCYNDQAEITWASIYQEAELTTVTKLPRRIFSFSAQQIQKACRMCQPSEVFLNFVNYLPDQNPSDLIDVIDNACNVGRNHDWSRFPSKGVTMLGYGPTIKDIKEM